MCFFDSPTARCELIHELVLTDETQAECAREHECPTGRVCPLCAYFVERRVGLGKDGMKRNPVPPRIRRQVAQYGRP